MSNLSLLQRLYTEASRTAFHELREARPGEDFYAFALYSDDGAMTVVPAGNSEQSRQRVESRYAEEGFSVADIGAHHLRYCPGEWSYSGSRWEVWQKPSELHERVMDEYRSRDAFLEFKQGLFRLLVECLGDLDAEGLFGTGSEREAVTLLAWVTDSDVARDLWVASAQYLNPKSVFRRFEAGLNNR